MTKFASPQPESYRAGSSRPDGNEGDTPSVFKDCRGAKVSLIRRSEMDITTLLVIVLIVLLLGGGWYGRGRWY
ncbi:hypothetical protein CN190_21075 [Sinorhizobium meliloti]|nr:hypothetical protein CN190_21075 [Sinorhizobium meliloti]